MKHLLAFFFLISTVPLSAQFGVGLTTGIDFYQLYDQGEKANQVKSTTTGSVLANIIFGPKIWLGGSKFSFSLEAPVNWGMLALDVNEYKGLGALAFPISGKFNFGAASGFNDLQVLGWNFGGGVQFTNTEIYYTENLFKDRIETGFIRTYFAEIGASFGMGGADFNLYVRYGRNDQASRVVHVGLVMNANLLFIGKIRERDYGNMPIHEAQLRKKRPFLQ